MSLRALIACAVAAITTSAAHAQSCVVWSVPAQGPNGRVDELINFNGKLIARGSFTNIGGFAAKGVAQFNGTTWTSMDAGLETVGSYTAPTGGGARNTIAAWGGRVYAIGPTTSPSTSNGGIWNGTTWTPWNPYLFQHVSGSPFALFPLSDGTLLVDGAFTYYDNDDLFVVRRRRLALWDGVNFVPLSTAQYGPRLNTTFTGQGVYHAVRHEGKIVLFTVTALSTGNDWNSNNIPVPSGMITFDGTSFAPHPAPALNGTITCSAVFNGELYVAGNFTAAADNPGVPLNHIARWVGGQWQKCGNGLSREVFHMKVANDGTGEKLHIYNGGTYVTVAYNNPNSTTLDTFNFAGAVRFDGSRFTPYGGGSFPGYVAGATQVAATLDPGTGPAIYLGGSTYQPSGGGFPVTNFARRGIAPSPDTDGDGLLDAWEQNGIDIDCDGVIDLDLPAMGAHWRHKDIFVEIDSMVGRNPAPAALQAVVDAFANAPQSLVNNPDGVPGVSLHLIVDPGDQNIPLADFPQAFVNFHDLKAERFGNPADRASPNRAAIIAAKQMAFRYCMFANRFDAIGSSGVAELPGNDFMVTLGLFRPAGGTVDQQAGTFMHELGHTLNLFHGGHQEDENKYNFKPNYHSVMNYSWQFPQGRAGWTLDFSREALHELDEHALDEFFGISGAAGAFAAVGPLPPRTVEELGVVDWNRNGVTDESVVSVDINRLDADYPTSLDVLEGSEDWSRLLYNFRSSDNWTNGASLHTTADVDKMTQALADRLTAIVTPPACPADLGAAGGVVGADGALNNNDFIAFITHFFNHDARADLGTTGGLPGSDGQYNNNDFIAFINLFFEGCG